jgi:hypothetical protein
MPSLKALAGTLMLLAFVVAYIVLAMLLAAIMLPNAGSLRQFAFYAIAGLAWVPVAGWIISWMYRR